LLNDLLKQYSDLCESRSCARMCVRVRMCARATDRKSERENVCVWVPSVLVRARAPTVIKRHISYFTYIHPYSPIVCCVHVCVCVRACVCECVSVRVCLCVCACAMYGRYKTSCISQPSQMQASKPSDVALRKTPVNPCSVLQCVAVRCDVLHCATLCCKVLQGVTV